jgi:hypothetical protein
MPRIKTRYNIHMHQLRYASFVAGIALLAQPALAFAQTAAPSAIGQPAAPAPANTVNCFDNYHFGSVQVDVNPSVQSAVSGTPITFSGTIKNANTYPIVDGSVYVKIFKERGDGSKDSNGPDVVDQFYAVDGISLPAGGSKPVQFSWNVPSYAISGSYKVATFFTVSHKFNLLGLPFTDDVVGNTADFKISSEQKGTVGFDKTSVTIDGQLCHFAAFPPQEDPSAPVTVEATLTNTTGKNVTVPVTWTLNWWSGNDASNVLSTRTDQVTIPPGAQKTVSFTANDANYPVYLLTGVVKWDDSSSIINVRFVRTGKDRLRINFPAVTSFPLTSGTPTTLFSCLHNAGESPAVSGSRVVLSLLDQGGKTIHSYTYSGDVTGAMMGVADEFSPKSTYDVFTLNAKLYQGDNLVDQSNVTYDCQQIDPSLCLNPRNAGSSNAVMQLFGWLVAIIIIVGLIYLVQLMRRGRGTYDYCYN